MSGEVQGLVSVPGLSQLVIRKSPRSRRERGDLVFTASNCWKVGTLANRLMAFINSEMMGLGPARDQFSEVSECS